MYEYLMDNGMTRDEYHFCLEHGRALTPRCIMGNDYYSSNEYLVHEGEDNPRPAGEIFGYYVITHQYFDRYHLPVMHTETNFKEDANTAPRWLHKEWSNVVRLKQDGVPIHGFTWYSLIDQTDWDVGLREINDRTIPCGLFDKNRKPHPVSDAYKRLIANWRNKLPREEMHRNLHLEPFEPGDGPEMVRPGPHGHHGKPGRDGTPLVSRTGKRRRTKSAAEKAGRGG